VEGERAEEPPKVLPADREFWEGRKTHLEASGAAVEVHPLTSLEVGTITGETGARAWATVVLATYSDRSTLEVYPPDPVLALAAVLKFGILFEFASTNCGTPEELYVQAAKVTQAAALCLSLRDSITALDHLVPGDYCASCRAAYRCPKLRTEAHREVFGPLQAEDEAGLVPVSLRARLAEGTMAEVLSRAMQKIPMVEAWCAAVRVQAGLKKAKTAPKKRRKRRATSGSASG
jgi:hypothetical protein